MKAIMISVKPRWCALEMNGDKTIEVRKEGVGKAIQKLIDEQGFADIYVYCSKGKPLIYCSDKRWHWHIKETKNFQYDMRFSYCAGFNGKVLFKFRCYKVEEIKHYIGVFWRCGGHPYYTNNVDEYKLLKRSCLSIIELENYLKGNIGYAIHISDLEIFDRPKELSEFSGIRPNGLTYMLEKAPQNFCYVEVE